ncbi:hypothetical protein NGB36_01175 [Streptomyces sp. RB6PN25]|uniref:Uncharacterized protein n=1 Tax=Streptomyces humicola TaxID=2953240 RepID=A0ABT1PNK0_9ACTN|nr:hypothetical protein [Streptomyces humicola]MCQ4079257.1 hypothetical protein [Streptomyces humicola]
MRPTSSTPCSCATDTAGLDFADGWIENTTSGSRLTGGALPPLVLDILAAGGVLAKLAREGYIPIPAAS